MTDLQDAFCREYIIDLNGAKAAERAGYSIKTARQKACELLSNPDIQQRVSELKQERNERNQIDADYVLRQAVKLHERCMQEVSVKKGEAGIGMDEGGNIVGIFEFNASGAAKALELIGKHVSVQAFKDSVNHSGDIGITWNEERTYEAKSETDDRP